MVVQTETRYICENCGANLRTKEICENHEIACKKDTAEKMVYKKRVRQLSVDEYIFYGKSTVDVENCVLHNLMGDFDDYDYENFKYPCFVLLSKYRESEPYESYDTSYVNIRLLDDYVNKIKEVKEEILQENQ